ncbi:unnamed protein product [Adineta ricciae]|uniref:Uncharacterized protein n=1 Tax=Adineta ricciae TaxID=249248 RepID=A0A815GT14_ADIRI|nr:unnamed protein product [Adineta ricciae]
MIRLCTTPLWDENITNLSYPYLTECFRNTILQWIPLSVFWFVLPLWIYVLNRRGRKLQAMRISSLFISKMIFTVFFILMQITNAATEVNNQAVFFTSIIYIITSITILWLINYDRLKNVHSSELLFIFWLLVSLAVTPNVIANSIDVDKSIKSWIRLTRLYFQLFITLVSFILNCFAEKSTDIEKLIVPESYVSFPSRIFYTWVTPLVLRGYKKPLEESDCWKLPISERVVTVVHQVQKCIDRMRKTSSKILYANPTENLDDDLTQPLLTHRQKFVFWHALFRAFIHKIMAAGLIKFVHDLLQLAGPLVLKLFLAFFNDPTKPKWLGLFYAMLLSVMTFCQAIFLRTYFHYQFLVGLRFRSAISGLVYRKTLKLSNASKHETTTGEIINLMAIDASHFADITTQFHMLWSGPFQITVILVLLYKEMQLAIVPGVILLFLMIPVNLFLQRILKQLTSKKMKIKDERIKMVNEILNGIRVLKLYAWEMAFVRTINRIRESELIYIRQKAIIGAVSSILWIFTPILVGITTFATYVLLSDSNILTAEKAFVSLALFNLLRGPLISFPNMINSIIEARVSSERIGKFLTRDEIDEDTVERIPIEMSNEISVHIQNGCFRWLNHPEAPLTLKNINLQIRQGSLVALVGSVGSGKSSMLSALLGEMNKTNGRVFMSGKISYVPQTAWIMNTTLRENVIFGKDFDKKFYNQVIEACALRQDLVMLPAKDQTEIGEKGINLSGGQRQRVSLARALYSNADIYLLDDPLSAVDAHVGAHIFKHVIGSKGLLHDKTRILVTHGVSHLHKCDQIVVISQGEIVDHGEYADLIGRSQILRDFVQSGKREEEDDDDDGENIAAVSIDNDDEQIEEEKKKLIEKEKIETGSVKFRIFSTYIRSSRLLLVTLLLIFFSLTIFSTLCTNIWLSKWTDQLTHPIYYMSIYSILGITQGFFAFLMQLFLKLSAYVSSRTLHSALLLGILRSPMSFFDTTPIGRILNRFAKEIDSVDSTLPTSFSQALVTLIGVIVTVSLLIYGSWLAIVELIPLAFLFIYIQRVYISSSRQLRRLDSFATGEDRCIVFLFKGWNVDNHTKYAFMIIGTFCMALLNGGLAFIRHFLVNKSQTNSSPLTYQAYLALVYGVQIVLAYWMMLLVMTYETGVFLALVFGLTIGYFIFTLLESKTRLATVNSTYQNQFNNTPCCQTTS